MSGRASSYTGDGNRRQSSSLARKLGVAVLMLALGGCAGMGLPFGEAGAGRMAKAQSPAKAMLASATVVDRVDPSDWETIRRTIAGASEAASHRLDWLNPDTGSNGTIAVLPAISKGGSLCRSFASTISDPRGVRRYGGDACLGTDGRWQLTGITADDVLIS